MKMLTKKKIKASVLGIVAVLALSVGGTFAYIQVASGSAFNVFQHGLVNIQPEEKFDGGDIREKDLDKLVRIKNDSQDGKLKVVPVYIRASFVPTWVDSDGNVMQVNAGSLIDYTLNLNSSSMMIGEKDDVEGDWVKGDDGYYYFTGIVEKDCYTDFLLEKVSLRTDKKDKVPEGGHLELNVLCDGVQGKPEIANKAWNNPTVDGKKIFVETPEK